MFEAKLLDGSILKRIVEAIKDVVNDVNIDVSPSGKHQDHTLSQSNTLLPLLFLAFLPVGMGRLRANY